jgi:4-amino-4-deoxy-L-arabinose transferase-like glycosyltransferase
MLKTGDIITPRYKGEERFQKPILFYWLILSSFKVFGVNWLAARLPSILFGAFLALLIYSISNLLFNDRVIGLFAALFAATTPLYYRYARLAVPDMALAFFITLALYYFLRCYNRKDAGCAKLFFAALALAFLIKGPIGLIIPLLVVVIFCLVMREKPFSALDLLTGTAIFLLITIPWFYFIHKIHGGAYVGHVWTREILQRLGYGHAGSFITTAYKGFFFYLEALMTKFFPYSLFLPIAFVHSVSSLSTRSSNGGRGNERGGHIFLIFWVAIVFFFFVFMAEKRTHYILALSPAVSILVGGVFKRTIVDKQIFSKTLFRAPYLLTLLALIFFTIVFIFSDLISGAGKIPIWKFALAAVPLILIRGNRSVNKSVMPFSIVASLSLLYIAMTVSTPFGLFANKMEYAARVIKAEFKEGDAVGIGSHGIIPEELQAFFETPVNNVKVMYKQDGAPALESAAPLRGFLKSRNRIFCVIKRRDFDIFIPRSMKSDLYILDSYYVWKRRIRFDRELRESFVKIWSPDFRDIFQNEIYIISNREGKK